MERGDGREVSAGVEKREVEGKLRRPGRRGGRRGVIEKEPSD